MQEPGGQDRAAGTDRMAVGDSAALDVDDVFGEAEFAGYGKRNSREGFVDLNAFDVAERPSGPLQRLPDGRNGADAEHAGLHRAEAIGDETRDRLESVSIGKTALRDDHCGRGGVEPRRVPRRDGSILAEGWFQLGERFDRRIGP